MHKSVIRELPQASGAFCYFHGLYQAKRGRQPSSGWRRVRNPAEAFSINSTVAGRLERKFAEAMQEQAVVQVAALVDDDLALGSIQDPGAEAAYFLAGFANIHGWLARFQKWLTELLPAPDDTTWDFFREEICDGRIRVGAQKRPEGHILLGVARRDRPRDNEPGTLTVDQLSATIEQMAAASVEFGGVPMPFTPKLSYLYGSDTWHPADLATLEQLFPGLTQAVKALEVGEITDIQGEPANLVLEKLADGSVDLMIQVPEALAFEEAEFSGDEVPLGDADGTDN